MSERPTIRRPRSLAGKIPAENRHVRLAEGSEVGPALPAAVAIFLIVILTALNLMLRFPDLGAVIAQYNQF